MTEKADTINKLDEYLITYFCREHPTINSKDDFKKNYLELLKYVGSFFLKKNILEYKINIFQKNLNFEKNLEEEIFNNEKYRKKVLKKISGWNFKFFNIYTYRDLFIWDCLAIFSDGNKEKSQLILKRLKNFLPKYEKRIEEICAKMYSNKYEFDLKSFINKRMYENYREIIKYSKSKRATVVFTATMSTGKSTLINAIIGKNIAPSKATACTSNIANFISCPLEGNFLNYSDKNGIKIILDLENTKKLIETSNYCYVSTYFNSRISEKKVNIMDTPGVDYSMDATHGDITRSELKNSNIDVLVYVMSAQNFGAKRDEEHLKFIRENVRYKKLILAINMLDTSSSEDDSILDIVSNIKKYLEKIKFKDFIVAPISGRGGLVLKNYLNNYYSFKGDLEEVEHFKRKFTRRKDLELGNFYSEINEELVLEKYKNKNLEDYLKAYVNTGLAGFEQSLYNFI